MPLFRRAPKVVPPSRIGRYELLGLIGQGSFGRVFKATDVHLDKTVAVKELRVGDPSLLRDEAQVLSELRHENIVGFRQFLPHGNSWYLVMDYVEGGSLGEWIRQKTLYKGGPDAHKQRIIHQDFKPTNVMVTAEEVAKVSDFGLARVRAIPEAGLGPVADMFVTCGGLTPAYCSPEQAVNRKLTPETDVWSWGLVVLEMFAGGVFWQIGTQAPEALVAYCNGKSALRAIHSMRNILIACFAISPEARPPLVEVVSLLEIEAPPSNRTVTAVLRRGRSKGARSHAADLN